MTYLYKIERPERHENEEEQPAGKSPPQHGKVGWMLLWLLGVPLPVLLVLYFLMN